MGALSGISIKNVRMDTTLKLEASLKLILTVTVLFAVRNMSDEEAVEMKKSTRVVESLLLLIELTLTAFAIHLTSTAITLVSIVLSLLPLSSSSRAVLMLSFFLFILALASLLLRLVIRSHNFIEMYSKVKRNVREEVSKISPEEA